MIKFLDLQKINAQYAPQMEQAASRVIQSGWYLQGKENQEFEANYARYIGTPHAVGCANGLDALLLIFRAYLELGVMQPGDEVIVPANTYIASILAISENGLKPILVEPSLTTYQLDPTRIEAALTSRTKAILLVHLYGQCAYTDEIGQLCQKHQLKLVEDNAQAHGCTFRGTRTGALGHAAAHSFYPGKNLGALGDGGAITTPDAQLATLVRALGNYGSTQKYVFGYIGRNSRLDEIQAAILNIKLQHLDDEIARRRQVARYYIDHIQHPAIITPTVTNWEEHVFHLFPIRTERRDALQQYLTNHGVQTLIHYPIPPHQQACYKEWNQASYPITELIHRQELSLPLSPVITPEEVQTVVTLINSFQ